MKKREEKLMTLLKGRQGVEGSRKLRRLITTVNYDGPRKGEQRGEENQQVLQMMVNKIIS